MPDEPDVRKPMTLLEGASGDWKASCTAVAGTCDQLRESGPTPYLLVQLRESVDQLFALAPAMVGRIAAQVDGILTAINELPNDQADALNGLSAQIIACWRLSYLAPHSTCDGFDDDLARLRGALPTVSSEWAQDKAAIDEAESAYNRAAPSARGASMMRRPHVELSKQLDDAERKYEASTAALLETLGPRDQAFDLDRDYVTAWDDLDVVLSSSGSPELGGRDDGNSRAEDRLDEHARSSRATAPAESDVGLADQSTSLVEAGGEHPEREHVEEAPRSSCTSVGDSDEESTNNNPENLYPGSPSCTELPTELATWAAFTDTFWISGSGECGPAPWKSASFVEEVEQALCDTFVEPSFWRMYILADALNGLDGTRGPQLADITELAAAWHSGSVPSSAKSDRAPRLRAFAESYRRGDSEGNGRGYARLALLLEAIQPTLGASLNAQEVPKIVECAGFQPGLKRVVGALLSASSRGIASPVDHLKRAWESKSRPSKDVLVTELSASRNKLYDLLTELHTAAGGRVQRTHCREAWATFIARVLPSLRHLYPVERGGDECPGPQTRGHDILQVHKSAADRGQAKYQDRKSMDRAAGWIADGVEEIVKLAAEVREQDDANAVSSPISLDQSCLDALANPGGDELEVLCARILNRVLRGENGAASDPFLVDFSALSRTPALLVSVDQGELRSALMDPEEPGIPVNAFKDSRYAAAVLLSDKRGKLGSHR